MLARIGGAIGWKRGTTQLVLRFGFVSEMGKICRTDSVETAGAVWGTSVPMPSIMPRLGQALGVENPRVARSDSAAESTPLKAREKPSASVRGAKGA